MQETYQLFENGKGTNRIQRDEFLNNQQST